MIEINHFLYEIEKILDSDGKAEQSKIDEVYSNFPNIRIGIRRAIYTIQKRRKDEQEKKRKGKETNA